MKPARRDAGSGEGRETAVIAFSGGMDSCVAAAFAAERYRPALLHVRYGQRTEEREEAAFRAIADHYGVPPRLRLVVDAPHFRAIGASCLTDAAAPVPKGRLGGASVPTTYVPFRNAFMLAVAVSWAEAIGARSVFSGITHPSSPGYPDCSPAFITAFRLLVASGTRPGSRIEVETPLLHMTKAEIVREGIARGAPLHLTWSCYVSAGPAACGRCESCLARLEGFRLAGTADPIPYERP
ncbi:MAG: 7-cyano-7-deazaguanine synthase [bacterium]|nr:7-cyano-7-deazaguanine synthase [bacterium]